MQKGVIISVFVIVFLGAGALVWVLLPSGNSATPSTNATQTGGSNPYGNINNSTTVTPTAPANTAAPAGQGTFSVTGELGNAITVKDFKADPNTEKDKDGKHYYLVGGIDPSSTQSSYAISYTDTDQSFEITLLKEPLGDYRKLAEQQLMERLDITATAACGLRYWVSTPTWVNAKYSTKNLGFSFCPGATVLP